MIGPPSTTQQVNDMKVFKGTLVHSATDSDNRRIQILKNSLIGYNDETGEIAFVFNGHDQQALMDRYSLSHGEEFDIVTLSSSQFLMPGLVDTHIHAPQYRYTGTGYDKQLLDWLNTYTFPTEAEFKNVEFAKDVYSKVVKRTLSHGTTTASYYGTIHLESTKELCRIIASLGQRALVGKVNMDNPKTCPDYYVETTQDSIRDTLEFIDFVEKMKNPLIGAVITPRFAISCSEALLKKLGNIATTKNLPIQTHLAEQQSEVDYTMELFPGYKNYTDIYNKTGLMTDKSYFAHCVHLKDDELEVIKARNAGISHCPSSNICIRSGLMDSQRLLQKGVKLGLGTDVAGGYHPSVFDSLRMAIITSKSLECTAKDQQYTSISHHEAFFMATLGGAQVLNLSDKIGNFQVGKQFDALLIDTAATHLDNPVFDTFPGESFEDTLSKFLYLGDDRNIVKVFVGGKLVVNKC